MKYLFLIFLSLPCHATGLINQISTSATITSTQILPDNPIRKYLIIENLGSTTIIAKFGSIQSGSEGIQIPAGGNYEPYSAPTESLWIKSASSTDSMMVLEGI